MANVTTVPVDAGWAERNLGISYEPAARAARFGADEPVDEQALQRELIDFDSEAPQGEAFRALATAAPGGLSQFVEIKWPAGLAPKAGARPRGASLPQADVLIVTWTVDEGHALSRVLTPGVDSHDRVEAVHQELRDDRARRCAPAARPVSTTGSAPTGRRRSASKRVTLFKSDSHMSQDGPKLPNGRLGADHRRLQARARDHHRHRRRHRQRRARSAT